MKRLCAYVLAALMLGWCGALSESDVALGTLSFTPPEGLVAQTIADEDAQRGIAYAAQSEDGHLRLIVLCEKVRKSGDASTAAMLERLGGKSEAGVSKTVDAGGIEFALASEQLDEGGRSVYFRTAAAVRNGELITIFILDYDGAYPELPEQLVKSVRWSEEVQ